MASETSWWLQHCPMSTTFLTWVTLSAQLWVQTYSPGTVLNLGGVGQVPPIQCTNSPVLPSKDTAVHATSIPCISAVLTNTELLLRLRPWRKASHVKNCATNIIASIRASMNGLICPLITLAEQLPHNRPKLLKTFSKGSMRTTSLRKILWPSCTARGVKGMFCSD